MVDYVLFFRMGDFYEFFFEDAIKISEILGIALTTRGKYKGMMSTLHLTQRPRYSTVRNPLLHNRQLLEESPPTGSEGGCLRSGGSLCCATR